MKRKLLGILASVLMLPKLMALPTVTVNDGPGSPGGIFNLVTSANGNFPSFCLEANEFLSLGGTYYYTISTAAKYNGLPSPNADPICRGTAWLYANFTTAVAGYINDAAHNNNIQQAIWWFEGESGGVNNAYVAAAQLADANWANDANGAYGVFVMNLWANNDGTGPKQDLLIQLVPDGGLTVCLLSCAIAGFGVFRRRLNS